MVTLVMRCPNYATGTLCRYTVTLGVERDVKGDRTLGPWALAIFGPHGTKPVKRADGTCSRRPTGEEPYYDGTVSTAQSALCWRHRGVAGGCLFFQGKPG